MICVFDVIEGPARGKRFWMRDDQRMEIGRISSADISVPADHHMSRHHLVVEATVNAFRVRDVGSANGTYVNNTKIFAVELCSGDKIRAGISTFEVSLIGDDESPHSRDGLALDSGIKKKAKSSGEGTFAPQRSVQAIVPQNALANAADKEDTRKLNAIGGFLDSMSKPKNTDWSGQTSFRGEDARSTKLQSANWWVDYFAQTKVSRLLVEAMDFSSRDMDMAELLQGLDTEYRISVVLNVSQLGRFGIEFVDQWRNLSRVLDLPSQLCMLSSDGSEGFWKLIRNSVRRNGIIVFVSHVPLEQAWLQGMSDLLRSPATLYELLMGSTQDLRDELLKHSEFVLFEQDKGGKLALLIREF